MEITEIQYIHTDKDGKPYTICDIVEFEGKRWIAERNQSITLIPVEDKQWLEISDEELKAQQKATLLLIEAKRESLRKEIQAIDYIYTDKRGCRHTVCDIEVRHGRRGIEWVSRPVYGELDFYFIKDERLLKLSDEELAEEQEKTASLLEIRHGLAYGWY